MNRTLLLNIVGILICGLVAGIGSEESGTLSYEDIHDRASSALVIPSAGAHELRVVTPNLLEIYIVSERDGFGSRPSHCDWIDDEGEPISGAIPLPSDLEVRVNGTITAVLATGFKRQVRFAPIGRSRFILENFLYVQLASPAAEDTTVTVTSSTDKWPAAFDFSTEVSSNRWSSAIHVNQVGYESGEKKTGHIGMWLGTLGELEVPTGSGFEVIDATTGSVTLSGTLTLRTESGFVYPPASGAPHPYQSVYEADFTGLDTPGTYRLKVPGLGASFPFRIATGLDGVFARTYAAGLFHQRSAYDHTLPHTRYEDGPGHDAPAEIPTASRSDYPFMWDWIQSESGGAITGPGDLLIPYVNGGSIDVTGGHHDAGDYSKYTTNVAQMVHVLSFSADAFPGVVELDNLGIPESDDGIADILQEAKWEADFLAKLQDADGGFYYAVFPRDRRFDGDVLPSGGDVQIVLPKNTVSTATAVGALADIGSSPAFRSAFGSAAGDAFIAKAQSGYDFLFATIDADDNGEITAAEIDAGYQKISFYGDKFGSHDELAYAAAGMFAATGDPVYEDLLMALAPDPSAPELIVNAYIHLWEGWGAAFRTYAFAARTGRLTPDQMNATYLAKVDAALIAAGDEIVSRSDNSAYGLALDEKPKEFLNPSYVFGNAESFDALVALQLNPVATGYEDSIRYNLNYTAGNNPTNAPFLTGIGWQQRREVVSQFSQNDGFVLPPIGLPVGNVQAGMPYLGDYLTETGGNLLQRSIYPNTGGFVYPLYDVWADTFEVRGELTVPTLSRGAAVTAWLFAQTPLKTQTWNSANATISGIPAEVEAGNDHTAELSADVSLTGALITWEASGQEPRRGSTTFEVEPETAGSHHVAADILFPDGRRLYAVHRYEVAPPTGNGDEFVPDADTIALYHFNGDFQDSSGNGYHLSPEGGVAFAGDNLGWMSNPSGQVARFGAIADAVQTTIPDSKIMNGSGNPLSIEVRFYPRSYLAAGAGSHQTILSLFQEWNASFRVIDIVWKGPVVNAHSHDYITAEDWAAAVPLDTWSTLRWTYNGANDLRFYVNDVEIGASAAWPAFDRSNDWSFLLGRFDGDIDELRISSVIREGEPADVTPPLVTLSADAEVDGPFEVQAQFTEAVSGFELDDVTVINGVAESMSGSVDAYTIAVAPSEPGAVEVSIPAGAASDSAGNGNLASDSLTVLFVPPGPGEFAPDEDTIALYHFNGSFDDASGNGFDLRPTGNPQLAGDNLAWMGSPSGQVVRISQLGDMLTATIPDRLVMPSGGQAFTLEAWIYPRDYLAWSVGLFPVIAMYQEWNSNFGLADMKWGWPPGPVVLSGITPVVTSQQWQDSVTLNRWHHLQITFDGVDHVGCRINGELIGSARTSPHFQRSNPWSLFLGNFDGDIDEVRVSSVEREPVEPGGGSGGNDTVSPGVVISTPVEQPVVADFPVVVNFSEPISGLTPDDFVVFNGTLSGLVGSGDIFTFMVAPESTGNISISLPAGKVSDAGGNVNVPSNLHEVVYVAPGTPGIHAEKTVDAGTIGLFPLNGDFEDESDGDLELEASGNVTLVDDDLSWMTSPDGSAARFSGAGDTLSVLISDSALLPPGGQPISVEAWIRPRSYSGFGIDNLPILSLRQDWDASLEVRDRKWGTDPSGPNVLAGIVEFVDAKTWADLVTPNVWHHVTLSYDGLTTVECLVDGEVAGIGVVQPHTGRTNDWVFTAGNFDGDIDDIRISSIDRGNPGGFRQHGLLGDYYAGADLSALQFTTVDATVDFDWPTQPDPRLGGDGYSVRWRGCIVPEVTGSTTFHVSTGAGCRLWIDGSLVIDTWESAATSGVGTAPLNAGITSTLVLECAFSDDPGVAKLEWESAGVEREVIPMENLLINERMRDDYRDSLYPRTWGEWVASDRNPNKNTTPGANLDLDAYSDLLEYALGESPTSRIHGYPGFRVHLSRYTVSASFERPAKLEDIRYVVQGSRDLDVWFDIASDEDATVRQLNAGMESLTIEDIHLLHAEKPTYFRLKVEWSGPWSPK